MHQWYHRLGVATTALALAGLTLTGGIPVVAQSTTPEPQPSATAANNTVQVRLKVDCSSW